MPKNEQRRSKRQASSTNVSVVDLESGVAFSGDLRNVSLAGLLFHANMQPVVGADMELRFEHSATPQLTARLQVTRVEAHANGFDIAGSLKR